MNSYQKGEDPFQNSEKYSERHQDDEERYYESSNHEGKYHSDENDSHNKNSANGNNLYSKFSQSSSARYRAAHNEETGGGFFGGNGGFPPRGSGRKMNGMRGNGGGIFGLVENVSGLGNHGSFRVTWRPRIGPLVMNMGRKGPSSVSADLGPLRYMVWQRNRGIGAWFSSFDLPSILSFRGKGR